MPWLRMRVKLDESFSHLFRTRFGVLSGLEYQMLTNLDVIDIVKASRSGEM